VGIVGGVGGWGCGWVGVHEWGGWAWVGMGARVRV